MRGEIAKCGTEARSVVTLGVPYRVAASKPVEPMPNRGIVSSYAWGKDYHEWCWQRLEQLGAVLRNQLGQSVETRGYVDTGPILERDVAEQAGVGWHGKNTMLIRPDIGSWFFLVELLVNIDLPLTTPRTRSVRIYAPDAFGNVQRVRSSTAHSRCAGCISYLTIEHRGSIPGE